MPMSFTKLNKMHTFNMNLSNNRCIFILNKYSQIYLISNYLHIYVENSHKHCEKVAHASKSQVGEFLPFLLLFNVHEDVECPRSILSEEDPKLNKSLV